MTQQNILDYEINGSNGQIRLTPNRVIISRKGITGFITQGLKGEKQIQINRITAIQFKRADVLTKGYLQFSIEGSVESKRGIFDAVTDENTVMFTDSQQHEFEEVMTYINSVIDGIPIDFATLRLVDPKTAELRRIQNQKDALDKTNNSISRGLVLGIGLFCFLVGIGLLVKLKIISGLAILIVSAVLIPQICKLIESNFNLNLSTKYKYTIVIIAIIIAIVAGR